MDKYEIFKLQFVEKVKESNPTMTIEQLETIMFALDQTAANYDIQDKCTDIIPVYQDGIPEVVKLFITALAIENKAETTLRDYKMNLLHFFSGIPKSFDQITPNDIRIFLYNYKVQHKIQESTLEHMRIVINAFYNWCRHEGLITVNPCEKINPIKVPETKREPLDQMELELIREGCQDVREKALVDFLYSTGCRVAEVTQMKLEDINWEKHCATVKHGKGDKQRVVYLNPECELSLKKYLKERTNQTEYVFSPTRHLEKPYMSVGSIEKIIRRIRKRVELPSNKKVTPHIFRHTTATIALQNGMPVEQVQKMLGHEQLDTTMIYAKVQEDMVQESHKKYVT